MKQHAERAAMPDEISVGTPSDVPDINDEIMNATMATGGASPVAVEIASHVTPRTDIGSPPSTDATGTNTSSHGPAGGATKP